MAVVVAGIPHPDVDINALFHHYNALYFDNLLNSTSLIWSDSWMTSCTGLCNYRNSGCEIILSQPLLKNRSSDDVQNTLLHEMIHVYLYVTCNNKAHDSHGSGFREMMDYINSSRITDYLRPNAGYKITLFHDFHDNVDDAIAHKWQCQLCHEIIKRATPKGPSHSDCIMQVHHRKKTCENSNCNWHRHKVQCGGTYRKISEPVASKKNSMSCSRRNVSKNSISISQVKGNKEITNFLSPLTKSTTGISIPCSSRNPEFYFPKKGESSRKRKFQTETNKKSNTLGAPSIQHIVVSKMLDYYEDEATDEEILPLVNKRSLTRMKLKVMREKIQLEMSSGDNQLERRLTLCLPGPGFSKDSPLEISDDE